MTTEHVSVPREVYENLAQISEGNMSKHDMQDLASEAYNILSRATPSDEDDGEGGNCEVCGSPVRYGSRHHRCGDAMLRAYSAGSQARHVQDVDQVGLNAKVVL